MLGYNYCAWTVDKQMPILVWKYDGPFECEHINQDPPDFQTNLLYLTCKGFIDRHIQRLILYDNAEDAMYFNRTIPQNASLVRYHRANPLGSRRSVHEISIRTCKSTELQCSDME